MRFSVIVPSYLGEYEGAPKDRINKFKRCINSLRMQDFIDCEFIIVSDGCEDTNNMMDGEFKQYLKGNFKLIKLSKQTPNHSGTVRQVGISQAVGEYIVFVNIDDIIGLDFLVRLDKSLRQSSNPDFAYYDARVFTGPMGKQGVELPAKLREGDIGNEMITFKSSLEVIYEGLNGKDNAWPFIQRIMERTKDKRKLETQNYFICHLPQYELDV